MYTVTSMHTKSQLFPQGDSLLNNLISPRRVDLSLAFQKLEKSSSQPRIDWNTDPKVQPIHIPTHYKSNKTLSFPSLQFSQTFFNSIQRPPTTYLPYPSSRVSQSQSAATTPRSTPFRSQISKPVSPRQKFMLQLDQISKKGIPPGSPKSRSLVSSPPAQYTPRLLGDILSIKGLSKNETELKANANTHRIKLQGTSRIYKKEKLGVNSKKEAAQPHEVNKKSQLKERKINTAIVESRSPKPITYKLSDILDIHPKPTTAQVESSVDNSIY